MTRQVSPVAPIGGLTLLPNGTSGGEVWSKALNVTDRRSVQSSSTFFLFVFLPFPSVCWFKSISSLKLQLNTVNAVAAVSCTDELLSSFTRLCSQLFVASMRVKGTEKKQSVPTNDAQKSEHALLPSSSFLNIASNCPFLRFYFHFFPFPTAPLLVVFFTFFIVFLFSILCFIYFCIFCWFLFFLSSLFCASPPGVSFFRIPSFFFSFFTSSLLPQFFFFLIFSFLHF